MMPPYRALFWSQPDSDRVPQHYPCLYPLHSLTPSFSFSSAELTPHRHGATPSPAPPRPVCHAVARDGSNEGYLLHRHDVSLAEDIRMRMFAHPFTGPPRRLPVSRFAGRARRCGTAAAPLSFSKSGDVGSGLPVAGFSCFAFASFSIRIASGAGGGILASRSSSHFNTPSHSGSGAGGSGTISLISVDRGAGVGIIAQDLRYQFIARRARFRILLLSQITQFIRRFGAIKPMT